MANVRLPLVPVVAVCTDDFLSSVRSSQSGAMKPLGFLTVGSAVLV